MILSNYPLTSSISKELYFSSTKRFNPLPATQGGFVSNLRALKNTINSYTYVSPLIAYSSSARDLESVDVGIVNIPTVFYGSKMKPGTVDLKFYYTGSLLARAQDTKRNGVLYTTSGRRSGSAIGFALYGEGLLILTASYRLGSSGQTDKYYRNTTRNLVSDNPKWIYFAQSISGSYTAAASPPRTTVYAPNSAFLMEMSGTSTTQVMTMFANAPRGTLYQSNNPTFKTYTANSFAASGSKSYMESSNIPIKNVVSSAERDFTIKIKTDI